MSKHPWPEGALAQHLAQTPPKNWTARQWEAVCRAAADGLSYHKAATAAGLSVNAVIGAAHRRGFPVRPSPIIIGGAAAAAARARSAEKRARFQERVAQKAAEAAERAQQLAAQREARLAGAVNAVVATAIGTGGKRALHFGEAGKAMAKAKADSVRRERDALRANGEAAAPKGEFFASAPAAPVFRIERAVTRRDARGCQWPFGDPREAGFRFCAAVDVVVGRSYCAEHCHRAYTRTVEEVERAAEVARQVAGTPLHRPYAGAARTM